MRNVERKENKGPQYRFLRYFPFNKGEINDGILNLLVNIILFKKANCTEG